MKNPNKFTDALAKAKTEEDVKSAYAKFFDISYNTSDHIDLYTPQVLFEFKYDKNLSNLHELARVLAQALYYVHRLKYWDKNDGVACPTLFDNMEELIDHRFIKPVSAKICLADVNEFWLTETQLWETYCDHDYDWDLSPSSPDEHLVKDLTADPNLRTAHVFHLLNQQELLLGIEELSTALQTQLTFADFKVKKLITERNFPQVYEYWNHVFGEYVRNGYKASRYFVSDIQDGNTIFSKADNKALFRIDDTYKAKKILAPDYQWFWSIFEKVRDQEVIRSIYSKIDRLTDESLRRFHGEFFTPLPFAQKALDYIEEVVGKNWWETGEYRLWDMAAGTGNLEYHLPQDALKYCYLSTLDEEDVEHLHRLFSEAHSFQYNYLDDDVNAVLSKEKRRPAALELDFSDTWQWKMPKQLRADLDNPNIKWIILINPPFATAQNAKKDGNAKTDVSNTNVRRFMHSNNLGEVSRELFSQFIYRIKYEFAGRTAYFALFSKIKYINSTNDQKFRDNIFDFCFHKGFVFSSVNFSDTSRTSQFPVGTLIWELNNPVKIEEQDIILDVFNTKVEKIGTKQARAERKENFLSKWIERPACTHKFPPLSSAITIKADNKDRRDRIADGFLASFMCAGNDFQSQNQTAFLSGPCVSAGALSVVPQNFEKAMVVHAARRIPQATWLNDRDQFLAPNKPLTEEFITDCVVWSLFSGSNQTAAMRDVEYEGTIYQIDNHFFPFLLQEVRTWHCTDSMIADTMLHAHDRYVAKWLQGSEDFIFAKTNKGEVKNFTSLQAITNRFSLESQAVLDKAREIYHFYFEHLHELRTPKFKITTWDAGWYQIRMALKNANLAEDLFAELKPLHDTLRRKLLPQLTKYGILS